MGSVYEDRLIYMNDVERANSRARRYFFSNDTMRFFKSKIVSEYAVRARKHGAKAYFITSEKPPYGDREYRVREYNTKSHDIHTVGNAHPSLPTAKRELCHLVRGKMRGSSCTIGGTNVA